MGNNKLKIAKMRVLLVVFCWQFFLIRKAWENPILDDFWRICVLIPSPFRSCTKRQTKNCDNAPRPFTTSKLARCTIANLNVLLFCFSNFRVSTPLETYPFLPWTLYHRCGVRPDGDMLIFVWACVHKNQGQRQGVGVVYMGIFCQRKALNVGEIFQISQYMYTVYTLIYVYSTLPETNRAPENGWWLPGRCYVSIRQCTCCLILISLSQWPKTLFRCFLMNMNNVSFKEHWNTRKPELISSFIKTRITYLETPINHEKWRL